MLNIIRQYLNPGNYSDRPNAKKYIVLHHTGSTSPWQNIVKYFNRENSFVSSHYVVGVDGTVAQLVPDDRVAWHAGVSQWK